MADVLNATCGMPHVHWPQEEVLFCLLEDANLKALSCASLEEEVPALIESVFFLEGVS